MSLKFYPLTDYTNIIFLMTGVSVGGASGPNNDIKINIRKFFPRKTTTPQSDSLRCSKYFLRIFL